MNIRDALINQQPSLAGWREAQAEIARLDARIAQMENDQKAEVQELFKDVAFLWEQIANMKDKP